MRRIINRVLILLIIVNVLYVISGVVHFPLVSIDVYSIWLLKAKAFWINDGFPLQFLRNIDYSHPQYPILLPYLLYLISKIIGTYNELYILLIYPLLYVAILVVSFKTFTKLKIPATTSLIFVYVYSMLSPLLAQAGREHAGNADIWLTFLYWLIIYLLIGFGRKVETKKILLIVLLVAVASQIKLEGVFMSLIFLFLPISNKKKLMYFVLSLLPAIFWVYVRKILQIPADFGVIIPSFQLIIIRSAIIFRQVVLEMIKIRNWYLFWYVFWLLLYLQKTKNKILRSTVQPTLIVMSIMFIFIYLIADLDTKNYVTSSSDRIMLQLSPFFYTMFVDRAGNILKKVKVI